MKIAIIGAGMSGIGAARSLQNHDVTLWDKGASVGGRVGTRRLERDGQTTYFDHGAQNVKSQDRVLDAELQTLGFDNRVFIEKPTRLYEGQTLFAPDKAANAEPKWSCREGMRNLPQFLAQGLNVRLNTRVSRLEKDGESWILRDDANRVLDVVQRVIVTTPAPQAADLLETSDEPNAERHSQRIERLRGVRYSRCLSVLLRYEVASDDLDFYALLAKNRATPLLWLARENCKGFVLDNSTALVAQLNDETSCALWEASDAEIVEKTQGWIQETDARFQTSSWNFVKRWRFSQPQNPIEFEDANSPEDRVLVCGDGLSKARVVDAYESGQTAAQWINNKMTREGAM